VIEPLSLGKFMAGWMPALMVSAAVDPTPRLADAFLVPIGGVEVPMLTAVLGLLGVLMARPLAKRRETTEGYGGGWPGFALVTAIMLIVVELWIVEARPGALFAFVIAIGLGFSGYSLIELVGSQISEFVKRIVAIPTEKLGSSAKPETPTQDSPEDQA